jgi:hypothetical protein
VIGSYTDETLEPGHRSRLKTSVSITIGPRDGRRLTRCRLRR